MTRPLRMLLLVFGVTALAGACAWLIRGRDTITFSHKLHVQEEDLDCTDCHEGVEKSASIDQKRFIPGKAVCKDCHEEALKKKCVLCHKNPGQPEGWGRAVVRTAGVRFSHAKHLSLKDKKLECASCHAGVAGATTPLGSPRPKMIDDCAACHAKDFDRQDCVKCHDGLVETAELPLGVFSHTGDWLGRHGSVAKTAGGVVCGHCHREERCAECHARATQPLVPSRRHIDQPFRKLHHRADFRTRHAIEAKLEPQRCRTCHEPERDCASCHSRLGLTANTTGGFNPHPPDFVTRGGTSFHGTEARRDIASCASCHGEAEASLCVTCHRSGAYGGNPHPPGFKAGGRAKSDPGCSPCHL